jgi:hypothetical protein
MLEEARYVRLGTETDIARLVALGARVIASGEQLHSLFVDEQGHELAPETCAEWRWTLVQLGRRTRILIVTQPLVQLP